MHTLAVKQFKGCHYCINYGYKEDCQNLEIDVESEETKWMRKEREKTAGPKQNVFTRHNLF